MPIDGLREATSLAVRYPFGNLNRNMVDRRRGGGRHVGDQPIRMRRVKFCMGEQLVNKYQAVKDRLRIFCDLTGRVAT